MACASEPPLFCLQTRGSPGHLRPLWAASADALTLVRQWATEMGIPFRTIIAHGYQHFVAEELHALDHLAILDIETGNDASSQH